MSLLLALAGLFTWGVTCVLGLGSSILSLRRRESVVLAKVGLLANLALAVLMLLQLLVTNPPLPGWAPAGARRIYADWILRQCRLPPIPKAATRIEAVGSRNVYVSFRVSEQEALDYFLQCGSTNGMKRIIPPPRSSQPGHLDDFRARLRTNDIWIASPAESLRLDEDLLARGDRSDPAWRAQQFLVIPARGWPSWYRPHTIQRGWLLARETLPAYRLFYDLESKTLCLYWVGD